MNDEEKIDQLSITEADTTPPNPANAAAAPAGGWQMPEPKFQQSSGYLPQGYLDQVNIVGNSAAATAPAATPEPAVLPDVEPQPDLAEQLDTEPVPVARPAVTQPGNRVRVAMIVFGILGMIAFLVIFLGAIYYLFLARGGEGSQF